MHNPDNNPHPLPTVRVDDNNNNTSRLVVVATIAAILLAGSALVYRSRPNLPYLTFAAPSPSTTPSDDAHTPYHSDKKRKTAGEGARDDFNPAASGSGSKEKESKSSRSKDRRRRGKDPLKELLKGGGGKKYRSLALAVSAHGEKDSSPSSPAHNVLDEHFPDSEDAHPSSFASTSVLPDSPLSSSSSRAASSSNAKGKRTQREKSAPGTTATDTPANTAAESAAALPLLSSSASATLQTHPRGPSEVSQKHNRMGDGPSSSLSLENYPSRTAPDAHNGFADDRPPSSLGSASFSHSDDGFGRPHSSLSMADSTASSSFLPVAEDQARGASAEDEAHQDAVFDEHLRRSRARDKIRPDNLHSITSSSSRSPSASTADTTTTGATASASMSSSVMLTTSDALTPATSPTLSTFASGSGPGSTQSTSTLIPAEGDAERNRPPGSEMTNNSGTGKGKNAKRRNAEQGQRATGKMGGSGSGAPTNFASEAMTSKDKEGYKKPPRLQQTPSSSSSSAGKGLTPSASHPSSMYSPTKATFASAAASGSGSNSSHLSTSVSVAIPTGVSSSSAATGEDKQDVDGKDKGKESMREVEETFTFPTLNPTPVTAGPSRLRSDITSGLGNSSPRRAPTPRRPGTPSRSSATSTPPPLMSPTTASASASASTTASQLGSHPNYPSNPSSTSASNSNMPALSTQTQLASLRGALEAARLREEKNKSEMERVGKELEALRWENVNWRRAEGELQTHIRHLMHQVQSYAFLFSSMAPHVNPQVLQQQYQQYALQQQQQQAPTSTVVHPQPPTGAANPDGAIAGSSITNSPTTSSAPNVNGFPIDKTGDNGSVDHATLTSGGETPASDSLPSTPHESSFTSSESSSVASDVATPQSQSQGQAQQQQTPTQTQTHQPPSVLPVLQTTAAQMNGIPSPAAGAVGTPPSHLPMMGMHPGSPTLAPFFPYAIPSPHAYPHPHPGHPHAPFSPQFPPHQAQALMMQAQQMQQQFQQQPGSGSAPHTPNPNMVSGMFTPPMMSPHQMHHYPAYAAAAAAHAQMQMQAFAAAASANANANAPSSSSSSASTSTSSAASSLLSMSMGGLSMSGSGPSNASSPGSLSPDLNGSPSPSAGGGGLKKRRIKMGMGRSAWEDVGDGWVGVASAVGETGNERGRAYIGEEGVHVNGYVGESEGDDDGCSYPEFNELVADAIFKRPASLGVRSSSKRGKLGGTPPEQEAENAEKPDQLTEFTFPSLSDLGNVQYRYRESLVAVNGGGSSAGGSTPSSSSVSASASRSMSISPAPQDENVVPDASFVPESKEPERAKDEAGVHSVFTVQVAPSPEELISAPSDEPEILYDSSTSSPSPDETPREEMSRPLIKEDESNLALHEARAAPLDIPPQE